MKIDITKETWDRLCALSQQTGASPDDCADTILNNRLRLSLLPTQKALDAVAMCLGVSVDDIMGDSRKAGIVYARHWAMYFLREMGLVYEDIGRMVNKTHASAQRAVKNIETFLAFSRTHGTHKKYRQDYEKIKKSLYDTGEVSYNPVGTESPEVEL